MEQNPNTRLLWTKSEQNSIFHRNFLTKNLFQVPETWHESIDGMNLSQHSPAWRQSRWSTPSCSAPSWRTRRSDQRPSRLQRATGKTFIIYLEKYFRWKYGKYFHLILPYWNLLLYFTFITSIAQWIIYPLRRTSEHNHTYNYMNFSLFY